MASLLTTNLAEQFTALLKFFAPSEFFWRWLMAPAGSNECYWWELLGYLKTLKTKLWAASDSCFSWAIFNPMIRYKKSVHYFNSSFGEFLNLQSDVFRVDLCFSPHVCNLKLWFCVRSPSNFRSLSMDLGCASQLRSSATLNFNQTELQGRVWLWPRGLPILAYFNF